MHLIGRTKCAGASKYPEELCDQIIKAAQVIAEDKKEKQHAMSMVGETSDVTEWVDDTDVPPNGVTQELLGVLPRGGEDEKAMERRRWAREEEMKTFREVPVFEYSTMKEFQATKDAVLLDTTWVDTDEVGKLKSRLCAREFNHTERETTFTRQRVFYR